MLVIGPYLYNKLKTTGASLDLPITCILLQEMFQVSLATHSYGWMDSRFEFLPWLIKLRRRDKEVKSFTGHIT